MVNYLCRICLYLSEKGALFRKVGPLTYILDLLIPEIRGSFEVTSIVCSHCYHFLQNVEIFRVKSLENDLKLRDRQVVTSLREEPNNGQPSCQYIPQDFPVIQHTGNMQQGQHPRPNLAESFTLAPPKNNNIDELRRFRIPRIREADGEYLILNEIVEIPEDENSITIDSNGPNSKLPFSNSTPVINPPAPLNKPPTSTVTSEVLNNNINNSEKLMPPKEPIIEDNVIIELDSDDEEPEKGPGKPGMRKIICKSEFQELIKIRMYKEGDETIIKSEYPEENPEFFNNKSSEGLYLCQLCPRFYKTLRGLYSHTKLKHKCQLKFHHCISCDFFTIWRSALERHTRLFHFQAKDPDVFRCYNCIFSTPSRDEIETHMPFCASRLEKRGKLYKRKKDRVSLA